MDELVNLRKQIDSLDDKLLKILAERISVVKKIGKFKKKDSLPLLDKRRLNKMFKSILLKATLLNLSETFVRKLFNFIHEHSLEIQKKE